MDGPRPDLRHEVKMTAPAAYLTVLRTHLRLHPAGFSHVHPLRRVNNIYFDSQDLSRLNQNYAGISRRAKARFRWYGDTLSPQSGAVEFKQKHAALGWKETYPVTLPMPFARMSWPAFFRFLHQALPEPAWLAMHNLNRPVLINRYRREYLATPDRVVRLTLDFDQQFFGQWNSPRPNLTFAAPPLPEIVVEIKAPAAQEDRVADLLNRLPLLRSKNSKYVAGTERLTGLR